MSRQALPGWSGAVAKEFSPPVLPPLAVRARRLVEGNYLGAHRSRRRGAGVEFAEYRAYQPGDPIKDLDWRVYARTDRLFLRLHEEELARRVWILLDDSPSMDFGEPATKFDVARLAAASLAILAERTGDTVGVAFAEGAALLPAGRGRGHRVEFMRLLEEARPQPERKGAETDLSRRLFGLTESVRAGSLLIVLSDFLCDVPALEKHLRLWYGRGGDAIGFHFSAPAEWQGDGEPGVRYWDPESGDEWDLTGGEEWSNYTRAFERHIHSVRSVFNQFGYDFGLVRGDDELGKALLRVIRRRATTCAR